MKRLMFVAAALLLVANGATADYLLLKIDFDQIDFSLLKAAAEHGKAEPGKGDAGKFPFKKEGPAAVAPQESSGANYLYAVIEYKNDANKKKELDYHRVELNDKEKGLGGDKKPFNPGFDPKKKKGPMGGQPGGDKKEKGNFPAQDKGAIMLDGYFELTANSTRLLIPVVPGLLEQDRKGNVWGLLRQSLKEEFDLKRRKEKSDDQLLDLAFWALQRGLLKEFHAVMEELDKSVPDHKIVKRYRDVRKQMEETPGEPQMSDDLKAELKNYDKKISNHGKGHYVIYYKGENDLAHIERRLARFESTYANYLYWWALQESLPPPVVPKYRLPVKLEPVGEFNKRLGPMKNPPSGLTVRRENLVVLASTPNVAGYQRAKDILDIARKERGLTVEELLDGSVWKKDKFWDTDARLKNKAPRMDIALIQTLVVMLKQMGDDVETLTISREGTRQLLGASEFLSRNVTTPEWVQSGMLSYFEIAPAYAHHGNLYPAFGLPRADYLRDFKAAKVPMKNGEPQYEGVLLDLATDKYFRAKSDPAVAQALSWGLIFHLANERKLDYVANYARELNSLPRHMTFPAHTLETCFKLSFRLGLLESRRFIAKTWFDKLGDLTVEAPDVDDFFKLAAAP